MQLRRVAREKLISEVEEIKEKFYNTEKDEVNKYVRNYPEDFICKSTRFLWDWITGFKLMWKNAKKTEATDIQNYFNIGENQGQ